jgi:hypothetical protein
MDLINIIVFAVIRSVEEIVKTMLLRGGREDALLYTPLALGL